MAKLTPEDLERMRSVGYMRGGRTKSRVRNYREDGHTVTATTDENGGVVTNHNTPDDRQDVLVKPKVTTLDLRMN